MELNQGSLELSKHVTSNERIERVVSRRFLGFSLRINTDAFLEPVRIIALLPRLWPTWATPCRAVVGSGKDPISSEGSRQAMVRLLTSTARIVASKPKMARYMRLGIDMDFKRKATSALLGLSVLRIQVGGRTSSGNKDRGKLSHIRKSSSRPTFRTSAHVGDTPIKIAKTTEGFTTTLARIEHVIWTSILSRFSLCNPFRHGRRLISLRRRRSFCDTASSPS